MIAQPGGDSSPPALSKYQRPASAARCTEQTRMQQYQPFQGEEMTITIGQYEKKLKPSQIMDWYW